MNFNINNIDTFTTNYEDINFFSFLNLFESIASYVNAKLEKSNEQIRSTLAMYFVVTNHIETRLQVSQASQSLKNRVQTLTSKIREIKQLYITQGQR